MVVGKATRVALWALTIWFGYKVAIFVRLIGHGGASHQVCNEKGHAALVTLIKTVIITESITTTVSSIETTTIFSTVTTSPSYCTSKEHNFGPRLSHIIIPFVFHQGQFQHLERSLSLWPRFQPCLLQDNKVTLTILAYNFPNAIQVNRLRSLFTPDHLHCFGEFEILYVNLTDATDNHKAGSKALFESLITNSIGIKSPQYVFWMEPDTIPIRTNWLSALDAACKTQETFWIKGSPMRHQLKADSISKRYGSHFLYHINGNAIYNMAPDEYPTFYQDTVEPFFDKKGVKPTFFDVAVTRYLYDIENYKMWQQISHRFHYTEIIQNRWHEHINIETLIKDYPETFLIHGVILRD